MHVLASQASPGLARLATAERMCRPAASRAVPRAGTNLGQPRDIMGSTTGGRAGGRTRCALLTRYAHGVDTISSWGFIAAVTRTARLRSFGGVGLCADQRLGGRDLQLTCVCSLAGVSNGQGDSHPAEESHANVLCEADLQRFKAPRQM
jgi:hypothetical protein